MSTIDIKHLNNEIVRPLPVKVDTRKVKGCDICSEVYANIFLCSRKKSGKTLSIAHILKRCAGRKTKVIAFVSTLYKDKNWIAIRKMLENKGIEFEGYTSIFEDGEDQLKTIVETLQQEEEEDEEDQEEEKKIDRYQNKLQLRYLYGEFAIHKEEKERKPRKPKCLAPSIIFVFDDLSNELKSSSLTALLKKNRHFKTKVIISSQYLHDLPPESRKQLDVWMIFKGQPLEKLQAIYKDADLNIDLDLFLYLYKVATSKPYSFLYIDTRNDQFRICFNKQFILPSNE
jgi:hypothetical protein